MVSPSSRPRRRMSSASRESLSGVLSTGPLPVKITESRASLLQQRERVHGLAAIPAFVAAELDECEMQVGRVGRGIARGADLPDGIATPELLAGLHPLGEGVEVRVVIDELLL